MKVAFCLRNYLPETAGGTEVYVAALSRELCLLGVEAIIIKPGFGRTDTQEYYFENTRVIEYPEQIETSKGLLLGIIPPSGLEEFTSILRREQPDIVHFHEIGGSNGITLGHLRAVKALGFPVYTTLHLPGYVCKTDRFKFKGSVECNGVIDPYKCSVCVLHYKGMRYGSAELLSRIGIATEKMNWGLSGLPASLSGAFSYPRYIKKHKEILSEIFATSEKVFVLSSWFKDVLIRNEMPATKIHQLDKALPHAFSGNETTIGRRGIGPLRFIYLGRISEIKGLHILLKALHGMTGQNWVLDIYGPQQEAKYIEQCKELARPNFSQINWKGRLLPAEVVSKLQDYDALIIPTIVEEMVGLVVMEAFAAGIPVIGSNVSGIGEQVKEGVNGFLFKAGDAHGLQQVLRTILDEPGKLIGLRKNIVPPLKFALVAGYTLKIYGSGLHEKSNKQ